MSKEDEYAEKFAVEEDEAEGKFVSEDDEFTGKIADEGELEVKKMMRRFVGKLVPEESESGEKVRR